MSDNPELPTTVEAALAFLMQELGEEGRENLKNTPEDQMWQHHLFTGLGMWVRGVLNLWNNAPLMDDLETLGETYSHPDDASMLLIEELWRRLQEHAGESNNGD